LILFSNFYIILKIKKDNKQYNFNFEMDKKLDSPQILHDIISHNFLNQNDLFTFGNYDDGYSFSNPYKYSPESILHELYSAQVDNMKDNSDIINEFKKIFKKDVINKKNVDKIKDSFEEYPYILESIKRFNFMTIDDDDFDIIKKIIEKNPKIYVNSYKFLKSEKINNNIVKDFNYNFIQNIIESIRYRIKHRPTWKDFRQFFSEYPAIQKIFNFNKYPDNEIITKQKKINQIMYKALKAGQNLIKRKDDSDKYNRQNTIDHLLDKVYKLINSNHFTDNKKYYDMLNKKLEDQK
jgi:hypothetical protein